MRITTSFCSLISTKTHDVDDTSSKSLHGKAAAQDLAQPRRGHASAKRKLSKKCRNLSLPGDSQRRHPLPYLTVLFAAV